MLEKIAESDFMKITVKIGHIPGPYKNLTVITAEPILDDDLRQFMFSQSFGESYFVTRITIVSAEMSIEDYRKVKTVIPERYYDSANKKPLYQGKQN